MLSRSTSQSLNALPPGTVLRDYVIDSELGSGGFSIVYLARHHLNADWLYAIKEFLPGELAVRAHNCTTVNPVNTEAEKAFDDGLRRFRDEYEQLRKFRNEPYIVSCLNYLELNGTAYLVMDYDDGLPLSEFLRRREEEGQPFTEKDLLAVVEPLLSALTVVHRSGVLHRDIKPENIFVRRQDDITGRPAHPVLLDFGAAKQNYLERHSRSRAPYTPGYAAYEQESSEGEIGPWTDIYAVGAVMWRMVAGGCPGHRRLLLLDSADGEDGAEVWSPTPRAAGKRAYGLHQGLPDAMVSADALGAGRLSPALLQAIDRCLALYPEDRVQSCEELQELLEARAAEAPTARVYVMEPSDDTCDGEAVTDTLGAAIEAYDRGEYELALPEFRRLVELENPSAQYKLGQMYYYGKGVPESHTQAYQWFTRAAEQGYVHAQVKLAAKYLASKDYAEGVKWLTRAAEQGRADAQFRLGEMYARGEGVPKDHARAIQWYARVADLGNAEAQYRLGRMYDASPGEMIMFAIKGESLPEEHAKAVQWYTRAALQGHADAQDNLGIKYEIGMGVSEDHAQAVRWYTLAAEHGHARAQYHLGEMYRKGYGVPEDHTQACRWYTRAVEKGDTKARFALGLMYANRENRPEDDSQAIRSIVRAAEQGHANAQCTLGVMHEKGYGVREDHHQAAEWYKKSAEQGHAGAQCKLGCMYQYGKGVPKDEAEAVHWLARAVEQGHADAQCELGMMYELGTGVLQDSAQAIQWYTRAAEHGHGLAQYFLSLMYANDKADWVDRIQAYAWANLASGSMPKFNQAAALRDEVAANLTAAQLAESQQLSRELETRIQNFR